MLLSIFTAWQADVGHRRMQPVPPRQRHGPLTGTDGGRGNTGHAAHPMQRLLKKYYLFSKKLLYLVDDIFWHMDFNSADRQEKVTI